MKYLLLIAFSFTFLPTFNYKSGFTTYEDLTCTLTSDKKIYKVGEIPKLKVQITNNTKSDIYLVGSLDGSDVKWRLPYCYFSIEKPKPDTLKFLRCGNMNTLTLEDFKLIKAGQKFNPYEGYFGDYTTNNEETFKNPGAYKIRFHYSTNSQKISKFMGDKGLKSSKSDSLQLTSFFNQLPKVEILSNEIELIFK